MLLDAAWACACPWRQALESSNENQGMKAPLQACRKELGSLVSGLGGSQRLERWAPRHAPELMRMPCAALQGTSTEHRAPWGGAISLALLLARPWGNLRPLSWLGTSDMAAQQPQGSALEPGHPCTAMLQSKQAGSH